jgi:hypothetical protein
MHKILYCKETCETTLLGYIHCIQSRGRDNPDKRRRKSEQRKRRSYIAEFSLEESSQFMQNLLVHVACHPGRKHVMYARGKINLSERERKP